MNRNYWRNPFEYVGRTINWIVSSESDTEEFRLQKTLLVSAAVMMSTGGIIWGLLMLLNDEALTSSIPFAYTAISIVNIAMFRLTRHYRTFRFIQLLSSLMLPFLLMVALGGYVNSSAVIFWSLVAPLGAMLFTGRRQAVMWFVAFLAVVVISAGIEPFGRESNNLPPGLVTLFFALNVIAPSTLAIVLLLYFLNQKDVAQKLLEQEQEKSERLLLNVLPAEIAKILKDDNRTIADSFDGVSILFADVVGSTALTVELAPHKMVELLNEVFSHFDALVEKYDLEKIRTIGDNYMVASGVPLPRPDHAQALARMALDMKAYIGTGPSVGNTRLQFRLGMNSGPVVAGVIGHTKFHYDIWGDAVNIASRMESHGVPGKIQVARETYELIKDEFICISRGMVDVKGKGEMETWFLEGIL